MGMATLNVWVSGLDDPCSIDNRTWYITIYNCDGDVLEWCGRRFVVMRAPCGHLEVEVPPGCYYLRAVWSFSIGQGVIYVNHLTDAAIVQACCDQTVCVTLFNPSIHRCGVIFLRALQDAVRQKAVGPELARPLEEAMNPLLEVLPRPLKGFELNHLDELERLVQEQEAKEDKPKEDKPRKRS